MSRILVVGNVTLDIIHTVDHYPREDEELRALSQRRARGGNAATTAYILAQYGHQVSFAGTLADDAGGQLLAAELMRVGVDIQYCQHVSDGVCPLSCITLNQQTGSRTIVHYRDLPEYAASAFAAIPLGEYDWFHFEGRNLSQLPTMLAHLHQLRIDQPISLEIEKARPGIESLFGYADVLLFARAYAGARGCDQASQLFQQVHAQTGQAILICSWGEQGAFARLADGTDWHEPAQAVSDICDSVGAGDTFNAGVIHALRSGQIVPAALRSANALAAKKLQQAGFDKLVG
jgi:ketohexokinase